MFWDIKCQINFFSSFGKKRSYEKPKWILSLSIHVVTIQINKCEIDKFLLFQVETCLCHTGPVPCLSEAIFNVNFVWFFLVCLSLLLVKWFSINMCYWFMVLEPVLIQFYLTMPLRVTSINMCRSSKLILTRWHSTMSLSFTDLYFYYFQLCPIYRNGLIIWIV